MFFRVFRRPACGSVSFVLRRAPNEEERVHFLLSLAVFLIFLIFVVRMHCVYFPPLLFPCMGRGGTTATRRPLLALRRFRRFRIGFSPERFTPQKRWWPVQRRKREEGRGARGRRLESGSSGGLGGGSSGGTGRKARRRRPRPRKVHHGDPSVESLPFVAGGTATPAPSTIDHSRRSRVGERVNFRTYTLLW